MMTHHDPGAGTRVVVSPGLKTLEVHGRRFEGVSTYVMTTRGRGAVLISPDDNERATHGVVSSDSPRSVLMDFLPIKNLTHAAELKLVRLLRQVAAASTPAPHDLAALFNRMLA